MVLAVEGDDGETLASGLLSDVMTALDPFLETPSMECPGTPVLRSDMRGLSRDAPLGQAVVATYHLIWQADSRVANEYGDGWFERSAVDAWRETLKPFGLDERMAAFHGPAAAPLAL